MNHKNILYLITKSNWGGAQKYVFELATSLPKDKYWVKVMAGGDGPLIDKLSAANIEVISIGSLGRDVSATGDAAAFGELWKIIRQEKPDVLHVNSSKAGILGAFIGRLLSVRKIVFTAHGWAFNEDRPYYQKMIFKGIHWLTILMSHTTIAVSDNIAQAFKGWPLIEGKIVVIKNGIAGGTGYGKSGARQMLTTMFPELKKALELKGAFWVGSIAELHPIKNINIAIKALSELAKRTSDANAKHQYIYTVMGEGQERAKLEGMIQELGLSDRVFLLGHVADAFQYIKAFDAFLLPSRSEALAYVILEAGMQEAPVVATAVGGIPEMIEDMSSGILIQPQKPSEIAHALSFYAEHPSIARQYAKALNESVKNNFSLERMIKETEVVYSIAALETHS